MTATGVHTVRDDRRRSWFTRLTPGLPRWVGILLLSLLFAQLLFSANVKSPTIDEPNHLARGYAYLETGDLRLSRDEGHPPLFNLICALPLALLDDLSFPAHLGSWQVGFRNAFAIEFVFGGAVPVERLFFVARLPVIWTTLCLAALVCRWGRELYGPWGGVLALFLCVFDPNAIAHGRLVTTDMGITFFFFLAVYLFWRFLRRPSVVRLVWAGTALGLAQSVKFSAILLLPILSMLGLIDVFRVGGRLSWPGRPKIAGKRWLSALAALAGVMGVCVALAGLTIWAVYGLRVGRPPGWSISVPAPIYVEGFEKTFSHAASIGHPAFLAGQYSDKGWWYYFVVAFALKTPLPMLIVFLLACVSNLWKKSSYAEWPLFLIPLIYFGLSMRSVLNIGYRHLLPLLPFLWVYGARVVSLLAGAISTQRRWGRAGLALLGVWLAAGTLWISPHYLAYFNELAGGPDGGGRYLVDSNLDWGQDLWALKAYVERNDVRPVHLSWFGCTYPHLYDLGFGYRLLPSHYSYPYPQDAARSAYNPVHPAPGLYVIGATNLQGVGLAAGDVFASFRDLEPVARIGHSLMVYQVPEVAAHASGSSQPTCISGLRFKDLAARTVDLSLGRGPGAVKWFDHRTSFILPQAGDPVYVLPGTPLDFAPRWRDLFLDRAAVIHVQEAQTSLPEATVYRLDRASTESWQKEALASISFSPMNWSPATRFEPGAEMHPLSSPVNWDHQLQLIGYWVLSGESLQPGGTLELITVWRSGDRMPAAASDLRVFVHLLDENSQVRAAEDRLDLHPPTWEPGDLLFQYHRLPLSADVPSGTYQLELGVYTSLTMQRLAVHDAGRPVADRLLLEPVEVVLP